MFHSGETLHQSHPIEYPELFKLNSLILTGFSSNFTLVEIGPAIKLSIYNLICHILE